MQALVEEEDAEGAEMEPTLHWIEPPFAVLNFPPDQLPACGEESQEKKHQSVRHAIRKPVHYGPGEAPVKVIFLISHVFPVPRTRYIERHLDYCEAPVKVRPPYKCL